MRSPDRHPRTIPKVPGLEHSLPFLADPYRFIGRQCAALGSEVVALRLLLQPTLAMSGARAAELFYDKTRFVRAGAAPELVQATLFGKGGVQGLDGAEHLLRKQLFLEAVSPARTAALMRHAEAALDAAFADWTRQRRIVLYPAAQRWLTEAACNWAGVVVPAEEIGLRAGQLAALFDHAASGVREHFHARAARRQAEGWCARLVEQERHVPRDPDSVLALVANWRDSSGALLPPRIAAVELLNLLRPTVAVSVFVVFVAHALHQNLACAAVVRQGGPAEALAFVQEVRRSYPFFPALAARVAADFEWEGYHFPAGRRVLLDLYGTNHERARWPQPGAFRPERFLHDAAGLFDLVPQGGGRAEDHHRCPGEDITVRLMLLALRRLIAHRWRAPPQDLRLQLRRMPAVPVSGMEVELG